MRVVSRRLFAVFLLLGVTLCHAEILPRRGSVDPRVREVIFDKNDVISLIGYEGYQTHLKLAEDEEFIGIGAGDTGGLDITAEGNDTWIKPKAVMVRTNFDLKTNKRVYHFDYQSRKSPPKNRNQMIYSITFRYPEDEAQQRTTWSAQERLKRKLMATGSGAINRDYWYCGNPTMKPVEAYDDGLQTHVRFSAYAEFPAIFVENEDNTEALINFHIDPDNGEVVIHRIGRRFVLRRGDLVGCIENRQFTGGGKRTASGTIKPDVIRETQPTGEATYD
jgi:type IV secretion system protein VirB9